MNDLRGKIADLLADERTVPTTSAAMDVIMAVIGSIGYTDQLHEEESDTGRRRRAIDSHGPSVSRYAIDAESALRIVRRHR